MMVIQLDVDIILHMIYKHRLPTMRGGGIDIPVVCPAFLRSEFGMHGNPGALLKVICNNDSFPFRLVHQKGMTKNQLTFPPHLDWRGFVGEDYNHGTVGGYAFIPKEIDIYGGELYKIAHNLSWWKEPDLIKYASLYEEQVITPIIEERKDHE